MSAADYDDAFTVAWYRVPVDRQTLSRLMERSDWRGWLQTLTHLGLFFLSAALAYAAFLNIAPGNWYWSLPVLLLALFVHGTIGPFMGLIAIHELQNRTARSFCRNASTYAGGSFWLSLLVWYPKATWLRLVRTWKHAKGEIEGVWNLHVLPECDERLQARHRNWARFLLPEHAVSPGASHVSGGAVLQPA